LLFGVTGLILFVVFVFGFWRVSAGVPPAKAAETYLRSIVSGDTDAALTVSTGSAAWAASRLKGSGVTAEVKEIGCSVAAQGRGWARVLATVELVLKDGSADVGWYSLDVVKNGRSWKVVSFQETEPESTGTSSYVSRADVKEVEEVFRRYLDVLASGDMLGAAKFLADPARKSQEMGAAVLGKGAVIEKVGICGRNQCGSGKRNW
jgi:hypothetical protein